MDKFSGLKAATYIAAKNFERWSKLAALTSESSSALHSITLLETSQLLSALLAELEAKDKRIAELEQRLATPVRLPKTNGYWTEQEKAFEDAITLAKRAVRLAGFNVVGDE